jgi:NADPH-dependent 2,4-dienoyl-CoA reductase/sulfur reductase-like enzyme
MFCGMGVCQDCLVTVDGIANQRACITSVSDGMAIDRQEPTRGSTLLPNPSDEIIIKSDVLVVGGGPAGLAAAEMAARCGASVVLVDERAQLGGQYYKQPADGFAIDRTALDRQFRNGRALIDSVERAGVRILTGTTVWAAFGPHALEAVSATSAVSLRSKRLLLATGAYERAVPMPGWTLPGFMTAGAVQTLLRAYQTPPGRRVLVSGNGPLNLQVAAELVRSGVQVVALAEAASRPGIRAWQDLHAMFATAPDLIRDGLAYQSVLRRAGVPTHFGHAVISASGEGRVQQATIAALDAAGTAIPGTEKSFDVDVVCTGFGFMPSNEIARTLGCRHSYDDDRGHLVVVSDERGRSSVDHVWVAGDSGGLGGARVAVALGAIAGADMAVGMGFTVPGPQAKALRNAAAALRRNRRFQSALWRLYRAPRLLDQFATPDTLICRCEEVPFAAMHDAMRSATGGIGSIKRVTRIGMGRCQGRYCSALVAEMAARDAGVALDEYSFMAPRIPFKPVPIGRIASPEPRNERSLSEH